MERIDHCLSLSEYGRGHLSVRLLGMVPTLSFFYCHSHPLLLCVPYPTLFLRQPRRMPHAPLASPPPPLLFCSLVVSSLSPSTGSGCGAAVCLSSVCSQPTAAFSLSLFFSPARCVCMCVYLRVRVHVFPISPPPSSLQPPLATACLCWGCLCHHLYPLPLVLFPV